MKEIKRRKQEDSATMVKGAVVERHLWFMGLPDLIVIDTILSTEKK